MLEIVRAARPGICVLFGLFVKRCYLTHQVYSELIVPPFFVFVPKGRHRHVFLLRRPL